MDEVERDNISKEGLVEVFGDARLKGSIGEQVLVGIYIMDVEQRFEVS